jgi:hypothetical protein
MSGVLTPGKAKAVAWTLILVTAWTIGLYSTMVFMALTTDSQQPAHYIDGWVRFGATMVFLIPIAMLVPIWQLMILAYKLSTRDDAAVPQDE